MVRAAATGAIDFTTANPRSRFWWLKLCWILDQLDDNSTRELYKMQHQHHLAVLDYSTQQQTLDTHWNAANELMQKVFALNFPWAKDAEKNKRQRDIDDLMAQWKQKYGDPSDPEVQARFMQVAKKWRARGEEAKKNIFSASRSLGDKLKKLNKDRRENVGRPRKRGK